MNQTILNWILGGIGGLLGFLLNTVWQAVKFPHTDGLTTFGGEVGFDAEGITVKQKSSGSVDALVLKVLNNAGATKFIVRNDGAFGSAGRYTASAVATVKGAMPIYDESNTLYGYVPVYTTYTP